MNEDFCSLRLRFSKTGRAVYISHLDLMRTMQRTFLRAGLPLKYSEGFNPHAQITFALPLSVGTASVCEVMDFKLREWFDPGQITFLLNKALPEGIKILEVYPQEQKFKHIKWLDVDGSLFYDHLSTDEVLPELMDLFSRDSLVIERKTKKGMGQSDIAPAIKSVVFDTLPDCVTLRALISAQEPTLNPNHMVSAIKQLVPQLSPDFSTFTRTQIYDSEMNPFR